MDVTVYWMSIPFSRYPMKKNFLFAASIIGILSLAACKPAAPVENVPEEIPEEEPEVMEDVTYEGTLEAAGISIYMEGTHRLVLSGGDFILLESDTEDLNGYMNEQISVRGDVRSTVEAGGLIMTVENIALLEQEASSADSSVMFAENSEEMTVRSLSSAASVTVVPERSSASVTVQPVASSSIGNESAKLEERTEKMTKDANAGEWTQQYCSTHIGFCIPVHKNWWFKSFGTTTSYLWHVELGPEELQNLGDGPLVVNLLSGALSGAADTEVKVQGNYAVGYRTWTDNRHFEISAPVELQAAVQHITANLAASESQE